MSHSYSIRCNLCKDNSGDINHGHDALCRMVQHSLPVFLANKAGWDVSSLHMDGYGGDGITQFICDHFLHNSFSVVSEYYSPGDPDRERNYPPTPVRPDDWDKCLPMALEYAVGRANEAASHLANLLKLSEERK